MPDLELAACPRCRETRQKACWLCRGFIYRLGGIPKGLAVEYALTGLVLIEPDWQTYKAQIKEMASRWMDEC